MTLSALLARLGEVLDEFELASITAIERTGSDTWRTTTIREAGLYEGSANGLVTIIEDEEL